MRDLLIDAFNVWFKISDFELTKIKYIVRMLHNASLLYAQKRRRNEAKFEFPSQLDFAFPRFDLPFHISVANMRRILF